MSSTPIKSGPPSRLGPTQYPPPATGNQALRRDKFNGRTSTPDSEALASSDDEGEHRQEQSQIITQSHKPVRRSSWLNETSQTLSRPRKGSFAGSMSPTASHPSTPSAESGAGAWGSHSASSAMGRNPGAGAFSWGTGIWNTSERKEPPSRFSEVLPSPTSAVPPGVGGGSFFGDQQVSPASREPAPNSQIPFAIPLHPTPKTYRSQSYSVGQLDPEVPPPPTLTTSATTLSSRTRHPALQHRPSRPSMLSEMSNDGSMLGKVKEVEDDDDESPSGSTHGSFHQSSDSKTIEMLTRENAMLRQQQQYNARIRPRTGTGQPYHLGNGYSLQEPVPEEADFAIDELDESNEAGEALAQRAMSRRMSEYGIGPFRSPFGVDSRSKNDNENLKKALWSSSLGFPVPDLSQSRRHSFANMPTRQGSISSVPDPGAGLDSSANEYQQSQDYPLGYADNSAFAPNQNVSARFGGGANPNAAYQTGMSNPSAYPSPYRLHATYANRAPSPHRNLYGMSQPRHNQLLHIVLFKCARADVFCIQEGTGLNVKPGDLVIVEADRGTDLGTVAKDNVDWQAARELKEHYAEEQYKWLMMYSQGAAAAQDGTGGGLLASSAGLQGSAVGGMGPQSQHHMQEPNAGELRPKLIKRLAQSHEIHSLRDKEGQEAKAKRVCMQKVKEHALNMEILDAEFQMDWKKLTFYYFADSYINFNSLVTDLFKIYKTRIWMSAINPASFASPTLGIQAPSGVGPGAVGVGRASGHNDRRPNQQTQEQHQASAMASGSQGARGFRPTFTQPFAAERPVPPASGYPPPNYPYPPFNAYGNPRGNVAYVPGGSPNVEGYPGGTFQQPDYQSMRNRFPPSHSGTSPNNRPQGISPIGPQNDWIGSFQGLSLNSH